MQPFSGTPHSSYFGDPDRFWFPRSEGRQEQCAKRHNQNASQIVWHSEFVRQRYTPSSRSARDSECCRASGVASAVALSCTCIRTEIPFEKGTAMPAAVKIKAGKYGNAIGLLLERGGTFQTRHERTLIVDSEQRKVLEEADLIESEGIKESSSKKHGSKKNAR
jgi:hypothetical protein